MSARKLTPCTLAQFLALSGRMGGPMAPQSEVAKALSGGLGWSNLHFFNIYELGAARNSTVENSTSNATNLSGLGSGARRAGKGKAGVGEAEEEVSLISFSCEAMRQSERELFSTILVVIGGVLLCCLIRILLNRFVKWLKKRNGKDPGDDLMVYPLWEIQVVLLSVNGLAEGAGEVACLPSAVYLFN